MANSWQEMDLYKKVKLSSSGNTQALLQEKERYLIFEFIVGLNMEVLVQILRRETLSSLNEIFSIVQGEESRRAMMLELVPTLIWHQDWVL